MKPSISFKSKFFNPYKKLITIFKFKFKFKIKIKTNLRFRFRRLKTRNPKKEMNDRVKELIPVSEEVRFFPVSFTPAKGGGKGISDDEDVDDACRSFENYLVEMIVEEGKVRDLMDVEELLYCWKNLNSPVFMDLVCRFYGELCKDLFSADHDN